MKPIRLDAAAILAEARANLERAGRGPELKRRRRERVLAEAREHVEKHGEAQRLRNEAEQSAPRLDFLLASHCCSRSASRQADAEPR
jgi:hypothetical protein